MEAFLAAIDNFHFLRPLWLLAVIPAALLIWGLWTIKGNSGAWSNVIDKNLLPFLLDGEDSKQTTLPIVLLAIAWLLASIAMAGPTWRQLPKPVEQKVDSMVIVLDLSLSMNATDLSPSRIARAKHKLADILNLRKEGLTALIVFAGDAHVVTPLTDDVATISLMISSLDPSIMPISGSDVTQALKKASELFDQAGKDKGQILLITDGIEQDSEGFSEWIDGSDRTLSILGVGTREGSPIPTESGSFIRNRNGAIVIPKLNTNELQSISRSYGGRYAEIRFDDSDIDIIFSNRLDIEKDAITTMRQFDEWQEEGPWLLLLIVPIAALAFRRGWLNCLPWIFVATLFSPVLSTNAEAGWWDDMWQRKDQQGLDAYKAGEYEAASQLFESKDWQGNSHYRNKNYEEAVSAWGDVETSSGHYNRGNALARAGKLPEAIEAYQQALDIDQDNEDAQANKELVEKLLEQQEQQQQEGDGESNEDQQNSDQEQNQNDSEQQDQQQDSQEQDSQQENSEQQNQDQQNQNQDSEQQKAEQDQENQQEQDASQAEQQQAEQESSEEQAQQQNEVAFENEITTEEQQALEQWLRRVPDDPSGLLRKKFLYESRKLNMQEPERQRW